MARVVYRSLCALVAATSVLGVVVVAGDSPRAEAAQAAQTAQPGSAGPATAVSWPGSQPPRSAAEAALGLAGTAAPLAGTPGAVAQGGTTDAKQDKAFVPIAAPPKQIDPVSQQAESTQVPLAIEAVREAPTVARPPTTVAAASARLALLDPSGKALDTTTAVGDSPVSVELLADDGLTTTAAAARSPQVEVAVVDSATADKAGLSRVAFTVGVSGLTERDAGRLGTGVDVRLAVDYRALEDDFGADWAGRLRLVRFAPCALTPATPASANCGGPRPVDGFTNDRVNRRISVTVPLESLARETGTASGFALLAGASSSSGDYATTSLNPAGSWSVGTASGNFSWSYPFKALTPPAGTAPRIALSYSSQAIDGLTADQNTQGGAMGPGWSLSDGFVERRYKPCAADGGATGDMCWASNNSTFSFAGMSSKLIQVGTESSGFPNYELTVFRLEEHSGWKVIQHRRNDLTGARGGLGVDNDGEYWTALAPDGTQYYFGYGRETGWVPPGGTDLGSVQTVPVVGNHAGEPCNTLSYNWCHQAYRWSLDRIEDANGRVTTFHYTQETNHYGVRGAPAWSEPYVTNALLARIEYGQLAGTIASPHTHELLFQYHYRCNNPDPSNEWCAVAPTAATAASFPDIPVDQFCPDSYCTNYSPTFFTKFMLRAVNSKVRDNAGAMDVSSYDVLSYRWVDADGAGSDPARLWLRHVQHVGMQGATQFVLPAVRFFESAALANRVDHNESAGVTRMRYYRLGSVVDEYGSQISVAYTQPKPCPSPWPASPPAGWTSFANNSWACYQRYWVPPSGPAGPSVWHKYVVNSVIVMDQSGAAASPSRLVDYQYPDAAGSNGGMAWHSDDAPLAAVGHRYWAEFRGFQHVDVITGQADTARLSTRHTFHTGMDRDLNSHSNPDGVARDSVQITTSVGSPVLDSDWLAGREAESQSRNVVDGLPAGELYSGEVTRYSAWSTTGTNGISWQVEAGEKFTRAVYGGASRYGRVTTYFDAHPWSRREVRVSNWGRVDSAYNDVNGDDGNYDDSCVTTSYVPAGGRFLNGLPHRQAVWASLTCGGTPLSDTRTYYDNSPVQAVANPPAQTDVPWYGNPTAIWRGTGGGVQVDSDTTSGTTVSAVIERTGHEPNGYWNPPSWGRPSSTTDAQGFSIQYTYARHSASALGAKTVTARNVVDFETVSEYDLYGNQIRRTDPNGRSSYVCYDSLARVSRTYQPGVAGGASCTASPSTRYAYQAVMVAPLQASPAAEVPRWAVQTRELFALDADPYNPLPSGEAYLDSWQLFDGLGRVAQTNAPSPGGGRMVVRTRYDSRDNPVRVSQPFHNTAAAGPTWTVIADANVARDETTSYDALGRPLTVTQLASGAVVRTTDTRYTAATVTSHAPAASGSPSYAATVNHLDPAGRTWRVTEQGNAGADRNTSYRYDPAGRLLQITDPANNVTRMSYNQLGWRLSLDDPDAGYSDTRYWPTGAVRVSIDANNQMSYNRIDWLGRITATYTSTTYGNANLLAMYLYDGAWTNLANSRGMLTATDSYDGAGNHQVHTEIAALDTAGRPIARTVSVPAQLAGPWTTTTRLTRNGSTYETVYPGVANSNLPNAETVTARFNAHGLPTGFGSYTELIEYDSLARPVRSTMGPAGSAEGLVLQTAYQASDGRLSRLTATTRAGGLIQDDTYAYDAPGNPVRIQHNTMWHSETECFSYDPRQRLQRAHTLAGIVACGGAVGGPAPYDDAFTVDSIGNITNLDGATRTHGAASPATGCRAGDHPTQATKPHALAGSTQGGVTTTFAYDCNGALRTQRVGADTTTYTWDQRQRLATVTNSQGTTRNLYDTTNNRVVRIDPNGTWTVYLGATDIEVVPWFHIRVARTYGNTRREFDGTVTRFATDRQGSVAAATSASGAKVLRNTPYGSPRSGLPNSTTNVGNHNFLNEVDDPATQTVYLNNRHYLPGHAVFASTDPISHVGVPASLNQYVYARANPITLSDPSGLDPGWAHDDNPCNDAGYYTCDGDQNGNEDITGPGPRQIEEIGSGIGVPITPIHGFEVHDDVGALANLVQGVTSELEDDVDEFYVVSYTRQDYVIIRLHSGGTIVVTQGSSIESALYIARQPASYTKFAAQLGIWAERFGWAADGWGFSKSVISAWNDSEGLPFDDRLWAVMDAAGEEGSSVVGGAAGANAGIRLCSGGGPYLVAFCAGLGGFLGSETGKALWNDAVEALDGGGQWLLDGIVCMGEIWLHPCDS